MGKGTLEERSSCLLEQKICLLFCSSLFKKPSEQILCISTNCNVNKKFIQSCWVTHIRSLTMYKHRALNLSVCFSAKMYQKVQNLSPLNIEAFFWHVTKYKYHSIFAKVSYLLIVYGRVELICAFYIFFVSRNQRKLFIY